VCCRFASCLMLSTVLLLCATAAPLPGLAEEAEATAEQRAVHELDRVRANPLELRDFLKRMPKARERRFSAFEAGF
jgi:hypothetical protein